MWYRYIIAISYFWKVKILPFHVSIRQGVQFRA